MNYIYNIVKIASRILMAQSEKDYKKYLRQKIQRENPNLEQLQLSTEVGKINQEVKEKLRKIKPNYYQYVYKWLIQDQLPQDIDSKFITYLEQYQYIKNNNKENILIPNNVLDSFANLYTFIQSYNEKHQPLNISVEKQKVRKQQLPFKHIASNGNYNMYIIQNGKYEDLNRLYGNNNGSEYGGLIATTSWCVALNKEYFNGYKPSYYYLITEGKTSPEALVHIDSHQFKKIDDTRYDKNHPEVYQLVYGLLKSKNKTNFEDDFIQLFDYTQNKDPIINDLINNKDFDSISNLIRHDKIKDQKLFEKVIQAFIDNNKFFPLYRLIMDNKIKDEKQFKDAIQKLIDYNQFDKLSDFFFCDKIKDEKLLEKAIQKLIDNNRLYDLYDLIRYDKIKDEKQFKDAIQKLIENNKFHGLGVLISQDKIKDENQVEKTIQKMIDNNQFGYLYYVICYDKIKDEEQFKNAIRKMIDNNQFDYLVDLIYRNKIKDEKLLEKTIQALIDYNKFGILYGLIRNDKIKDEKLIIMIEDAKNNANIKTSSMSKKLYYISNIIKG